MIEAIVGILLLAGFVFLVASFLFYGDGDRWL